MPCSSKMIAASRSHLGYPIWSLELEYPRLVHSEFMTHRVFSKNAASSRAITTDAMIALIESNIAEPMEWGSNKSGMQAGEAISDIEQAKALWNEAAKQAIIVAKQMQKLNLHKQVINRILEPFMHIKVVMTTTNFSNFEALRVHEMADPTIRDLATKIMKEVESCEPVVLQPGQWHVPYYFDGHWIPTEEDPGVDKHGNTLDIAIKISSSCCAQVSYRKLDDSIAKAYDLYQKLFLNFPVHASPAEHQATPVIGYGIEYLFSEGWPEGATHIDRHGNIWSGNLKGYIQHRHLIPNNTI